MQTIKIGNTIIKTWTDYVEVDEEAKKQINHLASLPFIYKHIAVMPDVHAGKGATIGTVIATKNYLIPSTIGVDIGCGMMAVKLPIKASELKDLPALRRSIERSIPVGYESHRKPIPYLEKIKHLFRSDIDPKTWLQFGTLGGGNHFIELSKDQNNNVWVIVHSGSRGVGKELAVRHIEHAKKIMGDELGKLPDPELAYLKEGTPEFDAYVKDLFWAQEYAKCNREAMMDLILKDLSYHLFQEKRDLLSHSDGIINCHHNYSRREKHFGEEIWVSRKGAVSAQKGEYGVIPGSMGAKSYIIKGKGNAESFCSCAHGAGRVMSRSRAKKLFSTEDLRKQTDGIECRKDAGVVDEIPAAYKNIDAVMKSQEDLVEIMFTLHQLICIKG